MSGAVRWARDLVNTPAGDLPPAQIAREAQKMAQARSASPCKVWSEAELKPGGVRRHPGRRAGSREPAADDRAHVHAAPARAMPIALTGKGITFDSGGLSIKDADGMETMK